MIEPVTALFAVFETPLGVGALAWGPAGIVGAHLPEEDARLARASMVRRFAGAREARPRLEICVAIEAIVALLSGERVTLRELQLDMSAIPAFYRRVYDGARAIGPGATTTYGRLAAAIGAPGAARAGGQALARNRFAPIVPCHRILAAGGGAGGFSAPGGVGAKLRLLNIEGALASASGEPDLFGAPQTPERAPRTQAPRAPFGLAPRAKRG